ncbi:MAG: leucine-rich repeat domain-containing protein [Prevotella sp.]|nr:leucine-rich repeat domain-containing protein [Prevotella sp.]
MKRINYFFVFVMLFACMVAKGQEFNYVYDGSVLVYRILSKTAKTCDVVAVEYTPGRVNIPSTAVCKDYLDDGTVVEVDYTVTGVGSESFRSCSDLTDVTIPNTVTTIGDDAFWNCSNLTNISIPNSVVSIGNSAFYSCTGLTDIAISNSVKTIGYGAFDGCTKLTEIIIPSSVSKLGDSMHEPGTIFYGCTNLKKIMVSSGNAYYTDIDGILFDKAVTKLYKCPEAKPLTEYTIPN